MSTFSLGNLHFLDDTGEVEQFTLSTEQNTLTSSNSQINQNQTVYTSTDNVPNGSQKQHTTSAISTNTSTNTLITNTSTNTSTINTRLKENDDSQLNDTTSSSSVEFDENLNVLNEFEGSEPNSLRTMDYSENQQDPNLPYQSVFTINTLHTRNEETATRKEKKAVRFSSDIEENDENEDKNFNFNFDETTFKPRPNRPKSAVKRQPSNSNKSSVNNKLDEKLNPIANKRPGLLNYSFWTSIEQEILKEEDEQKDKDDKVSMMERDEVEDEIKEDDLNEDAESLSSEKEASDLADDEESSKEINEDVEEIDEEVEVELEEKASSSDESQLDSNNDASNDLPANENTIGMLNELKEHVKHLFDSKLIKSINGDRILDNLVEIKEKIEQPEVNAKLNQLKIELIDEFNRIVVNELKTQKERNRLDLSDFKTQLENLEQQMNRQVKQIEHNIVDKFDKSIKKSISETFEESFNDLNRNQINQKEQLEQTKQLEKLLNGLEAFKNSFAFESELNKFSNQLDSKLNMNNLSSTITNLNAKVDLLLNGDKRKSKSIFSSDEEDEPSSNDKKDLVDLNVKLDEIKLLLNEINNHQKSLAEKEVKNEQSAEKKDDRVSETIVEKRKIAENLSTLTVKNEPDQSGIVTLECDLCQLANKIQSNIRSFRTAFYRQKITTYSKCTYTTNFIDKLDQQFKLGDSSTEHHHHLTDRFSGLREDQKIRELETKINTNLRTFIHQTGKDVNDSVKQLKQLGNFTFKSDRNEQNNLDDAARLKQIQLMRFNISKRIIKLNQMIVQNY